MVVVLGELDRKRGVHGGGTRGSILDRVGHGHIAVVIGRSVEGVVAIFRHRQRTSLNKAGVTVVGCDVDIDRSFTRRIGQRVAVAVEVTEGLDLQGRIHGVVVPDRIEVGIVLEDVTRDVLLAFLGIIDQIVGRDRGVVDLRDIDVD